MYQYDFLVVTALYKGSFLINRGVYSVDGKRFFHVVDKLDEGIELIEKKNWNGVFVLIHSLPSTEDRESIKKLVNCLNASQRGILAKVSKVIYVVPDRKDFEKKFDNERVIGYITQTPKWWGWECDLKKHFNFTHVISNLIQIDKQCW